ncbi:High affinity cGMP-specific 3',5'-cyclic phosphodiesterase 9A [Exaiptasia diaphana]|nr:High affinity cGMP-specific 3',5'-cyclic phosphodiesterase 9A [Exaiptasia diaphana]
MTSKVIYFKVGDRDEQAEISSDIPTEDVKDLFRCAAEAGPNDILKLYNIKGNIVNISGKLQENSPETRYRLEAVATNCPACGVCDNEHTLLALEERLEKLEEKILIENGETPSVVKDIKSKVDSFRDKLESLEHLSWLGLFKEMSRQWDEEEMLYLLQQMYIDLGLLNAFRIERATLQQFLYEVYRHYNPTPFHNFRHAFCVTQMMYGLIWMTEITSKIEPHEVLIMLTSALCHDLDHPGYNNAYQINARTELALRYNDISPLENHHCAVAFDIMSQKKSNILKNVPPDMFKKVREGMIKCILATDMGRHSDILNKFKEQLKSSFDFTNEEHKSMLMQIMIKVSDVSNEARPMDVAEPWLDCLLQEFFIQSDVEKMEGLPVAPFMDRDKVTKPSAQIGFIKFVLIPLFEALGRLFPILEDQLISPVRKALNYYVDMGHTMEKELKKKNSREESEKTSEQLQKENAVPKEKLTNGTAD